MYEADPKVKEGQDSGLNPTALLQPVPPLITTSHACPHHAGINKAVNFNPSTLNLCHGCLYGSPSVSPSFVSNAPLSPAYLAVPGISHYSSSPGFLTGAGFQFDPGSPYSVGLHNGSCIPPGHIGFPLHEATILGDKLKVLQVLQDKSTYLECRDRWGRVALVYAVLGNYHEIVEILLQAGANPDITDAQKCTPLHYAAYKGNHACIKSLLHAVETKFPVPAESQVGVWLAQDKRGVTPLHHASRHTSQKCLQALLKYVSPGTLDILDHKKRTPLHWAAAYSSDENVKLLIKHGANNLMPDQEGKTPLHWAAMSKTPGSIGCVRTLIGAAPSSVNWQDFDGITALHLAVAEAKLDSVDVILSVPKCNVDLTDNQFRTALHWACSIGASVVVGRLLDRGAHLGAVDVYRATPLHYAAQLNHADTVELLVRRPCVRDDPSSEGHTALFWAAARGAELAITAMVRHGASLTKADLKGCTPLHIAARAGHVSTVAALLRLRAPPDVCTLDGRTPLLLAAQAGHAQIVKLLAKAGASLDHKDNEGQCALHHAVLGGHLYLAQILIKAGTSVNVQDYSGRTPLHMAAYRGLTDIMFLLLENRGDVNARDHEGQSPLHWAAQQGHLGAVNTLLDFHAYPNYTQSMVNRYTPLDCAYVAEQLEIAQVLMEAGGLSVTKIMDIAALNIQAFVRGYLARKYFQKMKAYKKDTSKIVAVVCPDIKNSEKTQRNNRCIVEAVIGMPYTFMKKESPSDLNDTLTRESKNSPKTSRGFLEELIKDSDDILDVDIALKDIEAYSKVTPEKTTSQRRRSKFIASNIKAGARKKTVRDLELPDPGELGIGAQTETLETGLLNDASCTDDEPSVLSPVAPPLNLGQALFYPRKVASALITTYIDVSSESKPNSRDNEDATCHENFSGRRDDTRLERDCHKRYVGALIDEYVNQKDGTTLKDIESLEDDKKKFMYHNKIINSNENKYESVEPIDSSQNNKYQSPEACSKTVHEQSNRKERNSMLEERIAKSLEVAHKEAKTAGRNEFRVPQRRILSAEARKQAEDKWNSKLATLTVQVQRPSSENSAVSFSYNLTPKTKKQPVISPKK